MLTAQLETFAQDFNALTVPLCLHFHDRRAKEKHQICIARHVVGFRRRAKAIHLSYLLPSRIVILSALVHTECIVLMTRAFHSP